MANPSLESWHIFHERYVICACESADTLYLYRHESRLMQDGHTGLMEPGETHRVLAKHKPTFFLALLIDANQMLQAADVLHIRGTPHFAVAQVADPHVFNALRSLSRSLQEGADLLTLQVEFVALLRRALDYAEWRPSGLKPSAFGLMRALYRAKDFLGEHATEPVTLDELASASAVSRFYLAHHFVQEFGISPHAYLVQLRVNRACALLRSGMGCADAGLAVGFADQSHFTRHFKRIMGVTPNQYLRAESTVVLDAETLRDHVPLNQLKAH